MAQSTSITQNITSDVSDSSTNKDTDTSSEKYSFKIGDVLVRKDNGMIYVVYGFSAEGIPGVICLEDSVIAIMFQTPEQMIKSEVDKNYIFYSAKDFEDRFAFLTRKGEIHDAVLCPENCNLVLYNESNPEEKIYTMRTIMVSACGYFQERFSESWDGKKEVPIPSKDFKYVKEMVNYIHCRNYNRDKDDFHELIRVTVYYKCRNLLYIIVTRRLAQMLTVETLHNYIKFLNSRAIAKPIFEFMQANWFEIKEKNSAAFEALSGKGYIDFVSHILSTKTSPPLPVSAPVSAPVSMSLSISSPNVDKERPHKKQKK